jgi:hypothetical protein
MAAGACADHDSQGESTMKRDTYRFGPWTTALHHGSRLELSAFWRLRLGRLSSLGTSRAQTGWATTFAICVAAGLLVVLPLVRLDASQRGEEQSAAAAGTTAKPQAAGERALSAAAVVDENDEPYTAKFSNGVKVQFVGLSENPSKGKVWWAPDGTRLDEAPYDRVPAIVGQQLAREICWRWSSLPDNPDVETRWHTQPPYNGAGGGRAFGTNGKEIEGLTAWAIGFADSRKTCTVRFSVSIHATPWLTAFANEGGNLSAMARTVGDDKQAAIFAEPRAEKGGTSVTITHQIPGQAVRLLAVDRDGLTDVATSTGTGALEFRQLTYHFANLTPERIQRYELQAQKREFESIEFRNVSLHPNIRTKVEIVRMPPEKEAQQSSGGAAASDSRARIASH